MDIVDMICMLYLMNIDMFDGHGRNVGYCLYYVHGDNVGHDGHCGQLGYLGNEWHN